MENELKTLEERKELDKIGEKLRKRQDAGEEITLKTLKELFGRIEEERAIFVDDWVSVQKLRAEAVKWINSMRAEAQAAGVPKILGDCTVVTKFIEFFNLTEEKLENEI